MALKYCTLIIILLCWFVSGDLCPKQCDCDTNNGLNRASCINQNIIGIDVGVPKLVQSYILSHNIISELDNYCLKEAGYTHLQELNLSYNLIFWIGLHAFSGLDKLSRLNLSNNRLRFIPPDIFWDTPQLQTLDLAGNVFESLKNEPFLMHTNLQVLNMNNCRIKSLPDRLFTRLPNLKKIDLSENYMITLNIEVLRPLRKLERLELKNDYWQCNPDFMAVEMWILSRHITYEQQCRKKLPKMSEKMISIEPIEKELVDVNEVWNISTSIENNETLPPLVPKKPLTPFQKFDKEFSAFQAFVIGLEIGLAIGVVGTYVWLRSFCNCGHLNCSRPRTRRSRQRIRRIAENDMQANLLWNNIVIPDLETPPTFRRQLSLPDGSRPYNIHAGLHVDAVRMPNREETPPPPYNECRINI